MTIHTAGVGGNMNQQNLAPFSIWSSVQKYVTGDLVVYSTQIWQASTVSYGNTPNSTSTAWSSVLSGGGGGGTPGGSNTAVQYNSSSTFAGLSSAFAFDGATVLAGNTMTAAKSIVTDSTVGIGTDITLLLANQGVFGGAQFVIAGAGAGAAPIQDMICANGTFTVPTKTLSGDTIGELKFTGFADNGAGTQFFTAGVFLRAIANADFNSGDNATLLIYAVGGLSPTANGTMNLGGASRRWGKLFLNPTTTNPGVLGQIWATTSGVVMISSGP